MTRKRRSIAITAAAAVLAGGAAFAAITASGSPPASTTTVSTTTASATAQSTQASTLSQLVSTAGTTHERRSWLSRLRALGGMHGEFTFRGEHGTRTLAFERGQITSVTPTLITVRAADGTTWTWLLSTRTAIREKGTKVARTALADGKTVFTAGPVATGARHAALVAIPLST